MSTPSPAPLPARARRRGWTGRIAVLVALAAAAALGHVHLRLAMLEAGYDLSRESRLHHDLEDQNQKLRLELDTRRDPSVIERRARDELGMAPPDPAAIRLVRAGGTASAVRDPAAGPAGTAGPAPPAPPADPVGRPDRTTTGAP